MIEGNSKRLNKVHRSKGGGESAHGRFGNTLRKRPQGGSLDRLLRREATTIRAHRQNKLQPQRLALGEAEIKGLGIFSDAIALLGFTGDKLLSLRQEGLTF